MADASARGRTKRGLGEGWGRSKLKNVDIPVIRQMLAAGTAQSAVGKMFGVDGSEISRIKTGQRWVGW